MRSIPAYAVPAILEYLSAHAARGDEEAARLLARAKTKRNGIKKAAPPWKTRAQRRAEADAAEAAGKLEARLRSSENGSPRCEWYVNGQRCVCFGSDCDHVLGGRWKPEMEALPDGEGFMVLCRTHHQIEKHGGPKMPSLLQAEEHALRIGSRGLLRHVEAAIRRFNAKHPAVVIRVEEAPRG